MKTKKVDLNSIKITIDTLENDRKVLCTSLLNEIIFMQTTLDDLKKQVDEKGVVTKMCQGKYDIDRANPALNQYNTLIKNYSSCIKQLNELLPKAVEENDNFDDFVEE
jgi:hypothetical protein